MGMTIDLDSENLETVLREARLLRDYFYTECELKKEEVRFYYSGNRSIHVEIQPETLNISPHERLYLYIKEAIRAIADKLELDCVDHSLYAKRHLFRCVGTKHSKTGRFKVEINPSELNLSAEDLKKLGDTNRGSLYQDEDLELSKNDIASARFNELLEIVRSGVDESNFRGGSTENLGLLKGLSKPPVCIKDLLDNGIVVKGTRNRATLTLACFFKDNGKVEAETIEILTSWVKAIPHALTNTKEEKRIKQTESIVRYVFSEEGSGYHFACPFIRSLGTRQYSIKCKARCQLRISKEVRKKIKSKSASEEIIKTAYLPEIGEYLIDLIYDPATKTTSFAVYNPQKDEVTYTKEILLDHPKIYVPYIDENVIKGSVLLPSKAEEYGSDEELYKEVIKHICKYYNEPIKVYRTLYAFYILFTWLYDRFISWCYLQFLGRAGGGKSRAKEAIGHTCYRPTLLAGADTAACMLRMLNTYRGSAIIDEATFMNKSEASAAIVQILNVGYKIDGSVGRCEGDDNKPIRYMVGGPKIIATREDFYDDGLRSRCFVRRTGRDNRIKEGANKQPFILPENFKQETQILRNKLLLWRFRNLKNAKINLDLEIKGVESRINEIIVPIASVVNSDVLRKDIEELAREQQEDLKQQRQSTREGEVLKAICDIGLHGRDIEPADIRDKINENKKNRLIATHSVTKTLKRLELMLHKYGNKWLLTNCDKNRELLGGLFRDYDLLNETEPDVSDEGKEGVVKEDDKNSDLSSPSE